MKEKITKKDRKNEYKKTQFTPKNCFLKVDKELSINYVTPEGEGGSSQVLSYHFSLIKFNQNFD